MHDEDELTHEGQFRTWWTPVALLGVVILAVLLIVG